MYNSAALVQNAAHDEGGRGSRERMASTRSGKLRGVADGSVHRAGLAGACQAGGRRRQIAAAQAVAAQAAALQAVAAQADAQGAAVQAATEPSPFAGGTSAQVPGHRPYS